MVSQESPAASPVAFAERRVVHGANVRRMMARLGLTQAEVVLATGLDERTVRSLLRGKSRPHARTLHKFASGLGIDVDELFHDLNAGAAAFDRSTNPAVSQIIDGHPELFRQWRAADFDELFSRVAVGGELTEAGAMAAAQAMNERHELFEKVAILLETSEAELLREFIGLLYRRATAV